MGGELLQFFYSNEFVHPTLMTPSPPHCIARMWPTRANPRRRGRARLPRHTCHHAQNARPTRFGGDEAGDEIRRLKEAAAKAKAAHAKAKTLPSKRCGGGGGSLNSGDSFGQACAVSNPMTAGSCHGDPAPPSQAQPLLAQTQAAQAQAAAEAAMQAQIQAQLRTNQHHQASARPL